MQAAETISFILNDEPVSESLPPGIVVLDYLRQHRRLTGTKEGCREGDCGACLVLLGRIEDDCVIYKTINSCLLPIGDIAGSHLVTIEGLNNDGLNLIQKTFVNENASQCGFCTPGFIIALTAFFLNTDNFSETAAIVAMDGNICRCTGYAPIKRAAKILANGIVDQLPPAHSQERVNHLIEHGVLPSYFSGLPMRLNALNQKASKNEALSNIHIVAGGTDLFVQRADELRNAPLYFISNKSEFANIWSDESKVCIGAGVTVEQIKNSSILGELFPRLESFTKLISSTPIRNRATIGGNIVNASPIGDLSIFFLALDASLILHKNGNSRTIALKDFFLDYKKLDLQGNELIARIEFIKPQQPFLFNFEKVSKRIHLDIASVNTAIRLDIDGDVIRNVALSAGGVAPIPKYLRETAQLLRGEKLSPELVKQAAVAATNEIRPISDVRGSAEYKKLLLQGLIFSHFVALFPEKFTPEALL